MKILFLSSEVAPWSKTGGLGDVSGALPAALASLGHDVRVMTPRYASVPPDGLEPDGDLLRLTFPFGELSARFASVTPSRHLTVTFIEQPQLFDRPALYGEKNHEYSDNARRFAFFTMAALTGAQQRHFRPDVVHLNDWQTGLAALALRHGYRRVFPKTRSVFTVHNLAYQGNFPLSEVDALGIPWARFTLEGLEFYHRLSMMKAGLQYADLLTTVSPTYAKEIQTLAGGMGLDGVLRARHSVLHGVLNGVDTREWNPATDVLLPATFSAKDLSGRKVCQQALLAHGHLDAPAPGMPIFGVVGRMVDQKGADLIQAVLPPLLEHGAVAVILGSGDSKLEHGWKALAHRFPKNLSVTLTFDNPLAHLIEAGSDFFLMPSRFEPCGLNQMYSLLYGAVPVVHAVGGLQDTVVDISEPHGTGLQFRATTPEGLRDAFRGALHRALELFRQKENYERVRARGMAQDFSWERAARQYEALYKGKPLPENVSG